MSYLYLALAIVGEIIGSSLLKASEGFSKLYPTIGVIIAFVGCFFLFILVAKNNPLKHCICIMGRFRTCFDYSNFSFSLEGKT